MQKGTNWTGNYSRFSYDETDNYLMVLKEMGVPVPDDEFNALQEMQLTYLRRIAYMIVGDGTNDNGFLCVGTGAANNFTVKAGKYLLDGWYLSNSIDCTYLTQPNSQPSLTSPSGPRIDNVYLDVWYDEINDIADPEIKDPTLNIRTSCRLKLNWAVKVAENNGSMVNYTDSSQRYHWVCQIAIINRTASGDIVSSMMIDKRRLWGGSSAEYIAQVAFFARSTVPAGWLVCDGSAISRTTYSTLYAAIGTAFGVGDGTTTFNLPDMKGQFVRGWNGTSTGLDANRAFGGTQTDNFKAHKHTVPWGGGNNTEHIFGYNMAYGLANPGTDSTDWDNALPWTDEAGGGTETRPHNIALLPCIRYR